jgi:hypothetical protein
MSRRLGLRLIPDRVVDDVADESGEEGQLCDERPDQQQAARPAAHDDDEVLRDQPPALGATPAATPSG